MQQPLKLLVRKRINMKINSKQFYLVMIIATLLSFGGIIGAFYWGEQKLQAKALALAELKTDNDVAQEKIIALSKAKKGTEIVTEAENLLNKLLPTQKEQEKLVADVIYTASAEAGIPAASIGALTFTNNGEPSDLSGTELSDGIPGVYIYPFTMTVDNISYDTLLLLLQEIENNGRLVQIDNLQISPDKKDPGQIATINLSLKAFLKP